MIKIIKRIKQYDERILGFIIVDVILILLSLVPTYLSPLIYEKFIDDCLIRNEYSLMGIMAVAYLMLWLFESIVLVVRNNIEKNKYMNLRIRISGSLFNKGLHASSAFSSSDIKDRVESDIYWQVLSKVIVEKIYIYLLLTGCLVMMISLNVWFALIAMVSIPFAKLILKTVHKKLVRCSQEYRNKYVLYESWLTKCVTVREHIKANNSVGFFKTIFDKHWTQLAKLYMKKQIYFIVQYCLNEFKDTYLIKLNLYLIGFFFISKGYITVGILLAFMKYYEKCIFANTKINELNVTNASYKPYIDMVDELETAQEIREEHVETCVGDSITLDNVSFAFDNEMIIHNFDLQVDHCKHILINGESGVGKTTLLNLIAGVYTPTEGSVTIRGHSMGKLGYDTLAKIRSVVRQNSYFFKISVMDNLRLANANATDEEILRICNITGCDEFITDIKEGYNTVVCNNFSQGQMQRLAIARAIVQGSQLLLFDEPTSALDRENEERFIHLLETELSSKAVIVISHTIKCDKMITYKLV